VKVNFQGGETWDALLVAEFKAWLAIWLYMRMKRQSNMKNYWIKEGSVSHCSTISKIMSRRRFMAATYMRVKDLPGYDKLGQIR
jgi:hypothetical protein